MTPREPQFCGQSAAILLDRPAMDGMRAPHIMTDSTDNKRPEKMTHARKEYKDFMSLTPDAYAAVLALSQVAGKAGMDKQLLELIKLRASQKARSSAFPPTSSISWWSGARRRSSRRVSVLRWHGRKR
jgi:hypothetical protein